MRCHRCLITLLRLSPGLCWYCREPLCEDCWETYGHCGHADADRMRGLFLGRQSPAEQSADADQIQLAPHPPWKDTP